MSTTWKSVERAIARLANGKRVGPTGSNTPDVTTEEWAIEVKHRKSYPGWLEEAVAQSRRNAGDLKPMLVLHRKGQRYVDSMVVLRLGDIF